MKPIPKELQPYTARAADPARPWWLRGAQSPDLPREWWRHGEACFFNDLDADGRAIIDRTDPLPAPPILVGQVWGAAGDDGMVTFEVLTVGTAQGKDGAVYAWGLSVNTPISDLLERGHLLRCPFGYAPWSGPEVP